jgi:hypothetical protein
VASDLPARLRAIDHDANLRTAVERVVISRTTIEIELAEGRRETIRIASCSFPGRLRRLIDAER